MRNTCRALLVGFASLLSAASIGVQHVNAQQSGAADQKTTVRIGGPPSLVFLPFYAALDEGFFAKQGITVDLINIGNHIPALLAGEIDFSLGSTDSAVVAAVRGKPARAVVQMQQRNSMSITANMTLPRPNDGKGYPAKLTDLKGKTIGILSRGTGTEMFVKQVMQGAGMEEGRDYSIIVLGSPSSLMAALKSNQVDAVNLWSPFQEQAWIDKVGTPMLLEVKEGPPGRTNAAGISLLVSPDYLKARPDVVKRVIAAMVEGSAFARDVAKNEQRLIDLAVKYTGVQNREILKAAIPTVAMLSYPGIDCDSFAATAKGMVEIKSITEVPKCEDMAALDVAPKGPFGPGK